MKCQFCNSSASVHFKQVIKDGMKEVHLCDTCAEEKGITDLSSFSLDEILKDEESIFDLDELMDEEDTFEAVAAKELGFLECKSCGFSLQDFKKVGRMGCSDCYQVFNTEVSTLLTSMHRGHEHVGKAPAGMFESLELESKLDDIKLELELAIHSEDFEKAATLRDKIKKISEDSTTEAEKL